MKAIVITICLVLSALAVSGQEERGIIWKEEINSPGQPLVADLNMDQKREILVTSNNGTVLRLDALGRVNGSFFSGASNLLLADNGNGSYDLFFTTPTTLSARSAGGSLLWEYRCNETIHGGAAFLNRTKEVLFGTLQGTLYALDARTGSLAWTMKVTGAVEYAPSFADADKDGRTEIVLGTQSGNVYDIDHERGKIITYAIESGISATPIGKDINADGKQEIIAVSNVGHSYALAVPAAGTANSRITERWNYSTRGESENSLTVADINGDGKYETLFGSSDHGQYREDSALYVVSYNGKLIKKYSTRGSLVSSPLVIDIDGDGKKEILFGTDKGAFYVLNSSVEAVWSLDFKEPIRSAPAAYDYDGDKKQEIVLSTDSALYMIGSLKDSDSDGSIDYAERLLKTNISNPDTDGDGINDSADPQPLNSSLKYADSDRDGLSDYEENKKGTDPKNNDTDGDGILDSKDPQPLVNELKIIDSDDDGLTDWDEKIKGTNAHNSDTDKDGIKDGADPEPLRNILKELDSDNDTLSDYDEMQMGTDPKNNDTDADGMLDAADGDPLNAPPATTTTTIPKAAAGPDNSGVLIFVAALAVVLFMVRAVPSKKKDKGTATGLRKK
jgi:outer membrane protein assembly factor BamB